MDEKAKARTHRELFGRKIALERKYRALSLEQLSERTAIDIALLTGIEDSTIDFSIEYLFILFEVLEIDARDFFSDFG
ncbi:helix-turn-helix domain-containing protein [Mucilaginibacter kameinonensis]|uniref:helix-turn-helix domain-containing protein n=1 Tax=Mucilaginibacter kameinonensis TaxID=452286 RepID=UPI000EF7A7D6|nr:helix-turn-helix transcriptional regulator [Mucilaginibacter kameinonensis]